MRYSDEQIQQMREAREAREAIYDLVGYYSWKTLAQEMIRRMTGEQARNFLDYMQEFEAERYMRED